MTSPHEVSAAPRHPGDGSQWKAEPRPRPLNPSAAAALPLSPDGAAAALGGDRGKGHERASRGETAPERGGMRHPARSAPFLCHSI